MHKPGSGLINKQRNGEHDPYWWIRVFSKTPHKAITTGAQWAIR